MIVICWLFFILTSKHVMLFRYLDKSDFLLEPEFPLSHPNVHSSNILRGLVFCSPTSTAYIHINHTLHCMAETREHRRLRLRHSRRTESVTSPKHNPLSPFKVYHSVTEFSYFIVCVFVILCQIWFTVFSYSSYVIGLYYLAYEPGFICRNVHFAQRPFMMCLSVMVI